MAISGTHHDQKFSEAVRFLPHYGAAYEESDKVLIVGETHSERERDPHGWSRAFLARDFTREVVSEKSKNRLFCKLDKLLAGMPSSNDNIWNELAFYNYVAHPLAVCGKRPTRHMWETSKTPIVEVICAIKPRGVLFVSKASWDNFVNGEAVPDVRTTLQNSKGKSIPVYCIRNPCGHEFLTTFTYHPSWPAGSPTIWRPVVEGFFELLRRPKKQ